MPTIFKMPENLPLASLRKQLGVPIAIFGVEKGNSEYEEITCVGYNPDSEELHATVAIKQVAGYMGDVCSAGSPEYVRFFMSFDGGASWQDKGLTSFTAHDIPTGEPISYAVSLRIDAPEAPCQKEQANLAKVRAILSWRTAPPAGNSNFAPSWGNRVDVDVQLKPRAPAIAPLVGGKIKLPLVPLIELKPFLKKPNVQELFQKYAAAKVPAHRTIFPEIALVAKSGLVSTDLLANLAKTLPELKLDPKVIGGALSATQDDTSFEQLTCVGFDAATRSLVGVIWVKKSNGYSGSLCDLGSKEYVAFWVDWGDGVWHLAGVSAVTVHDIQAIGPGGLRYAVSQPLDVSSHRRPCKEGANIVKVRAILSWQDRPSDTDPNYDPRWGNRLDSRFEVPASAIKGTLGELWRAGRIALDDIESPTSSRAGFTATGRTVSTVLYGNSYYEAPFGGNIFLHGSVPSGSRYRFLMRKVGVTAFRPLLSNQLQPARVLQRVGAATPTVVSLTCDSDGWYSEVPNIDENILGIWYTGPAEDGGLFELCLQVMGDGQPDNAPGTRRVAAIFVDNSEVTATLSINNTTTGMCTDTTKPDNVDGQFTATTAYFGSFSFEILPYIPAGLPNRNASPLLAVKVASTPMPESRWRYPALPNAGVPLSGGVPSGEYSLETAGMQQCGYSLRLVVYTRTNVNSGSTRWSDAAVGFCVRDAK